MPDFKPLGITALGVAAYIAIASLMGLGFDFIDNHFFKPGEDRLNSLSRRAIAVAAGENRIFETTEKIQMLEDLGFGEVTIDENETLSFKAFPHSFGEEPHYHVHLYYGTTRTGLPYATHLAPLCRCLGTITEEEVQRYVDNHEDF